MLDVRALMIALVLHVTTLDNSTSSSAGASGCADDAAGVEWRAAVRQPGNLGHALVFGAVVEGAEGWREASDVAFQGVPISSGYGWPRLQLPRQRTRDWARRAEIHGLLHVAAWCIPERADWPEGAASPTNTCACCCVRQSSASGSGRRREVPTAHGSLSTVSGRARRGGDQAMCLSPPSVYLPAKPATGAPIFTLHRFSRDTLSRTHITSHDSLPLATCYTPIRFSAVLCLVS